MFNFDRQFFEKHQSKLLFIANKWYLRWLLGLNRIDKKLKGKQIVKIDVNAFHFATGKRFTKKGKPRFEYTGIIFQTPRFAEALAYNLTPFVYFQNFRSGRMVWRFSPVGLVTSLLLLLMPKTSFFGFMGTTSSIYSGYGECGIFYGTVASFASVRGYTGNGVLGGNGTEDGVVCVLVGAGQYYITRTFHKFDTSIIGSGATISAASLFAYNNATDVTTGISECSVTASNQADTITAGDFKNFIDTLLTDTRFSYATLKAAASYREFVFNATGINYITKTGTTKLSIRDYTHDYLNSAPAIPGVGDGAAYFYNTTYAGTDHDPYLSVTYSSTSIKVIGGVVTGSVKVVGGVAIGSIKKIAGLA